MTSTVGAQQATNGWIYDINEDDSRDDGSVLSDASSDEESSEDECADRKSSESDSIVTKAVEAIINYNTDGSNNNLCDMHVPYNECTLLKAKREIAQAQEMKESSDEMSEEDMKIILKKSSCAVKMLQYGTSSESNKEMAKAFDIMGDVYFEKLNKVLKDRCFDFDAAAKYIQYAVGLKCAACKKEKIEIQNSKYDTLIQCNKLMIDITNKYLGVEKTYRMDFPISGVQLLNFKSDLKKMRHPIKGNINIFNIMECVPIYSERYKTLWMERFCTKVQKVYKTISEEMKCFMANIFDYVVAQLMSIGITPPCNFALIGVGSLAAETITPYSDFEMALLMEDQGKEKEDQNRKYFELLTFYTEVIVLQLEETILPALCIPELKGSTEVLRTFLDKGSSDIKTKLEMGLDYYDSDIQGVSFDGKFPWACKLPRGRPPTHDKPWSTCLIQSPEKMAEFQTWTSQDIEGYNLATVLRRFKLIVEFKCKGKIVKKAKTRLVDQYIQELKKVWSHQVNKQNTSNQLNNPFFAEQVSKVCDAALMHVSLTDVEEEGAAFHIKKEMYRLPGFFLNCYADWYNCQNCNSKENWISSSWETLKKLFLEDEPYGMAIYLMLCIADFLRVINYQREGSFTNRLYVPDKQHTQNSAIKTLMFYFLILNKDLLEAAVDLLEKNGITNELTIECIPQDDLVFIYVYTRLSDFEHAKKFLEKVKNKHNFPDIGKNDQCMPLDHNKKALLADLQFLMNIKTGNLDAELFEGITDVFKINEGNFSLRDPKKWLTKIHKKLHQIDFLMAYGKYKLKSYENKPENNENPAHKYFHSETNLKYFNLAIALFHDLILDIARKTGIFTTKTEKSRTIEKKTGSSEEKTGRGRKRRGTVDLWTNQDESNYYDPFHLGNLIWKLTVVHPSVLQETINPNSCHSPDLLRQGFNQNPTQAPELFEATGIPNPFHSLESKAVQLLNYILNTESMNDGNSKLEQLALRPERTLNDNYALQILVNDNVSGIFRYIGFSALLAKALEAKLFDKTNRLIIFLLHYGEKHKRDSFYVWLRFLASIIAGYDSKKYWSALEHFIRTQMDEKYRRPEEDVLGNTSDHPERWERLNTKIKKMKERQVWERERYGRKFCEIVDKEGFDRYIDNNNEMMELLVRAVAVWKRVVEWEPQLTTQERRKMNRSKWNAQMKLLCCEVMQELEKKKKDDGKLSMKEMKNMWDTFF